MANLIHELANNEAVLLMYVAGELPDDDRAELENMLASDGGLRMELEEVRQSYAQSMGLLAELDHLEPISESAQAASIRQTVRVMRQWNVDRIRVDAAPLQIRHRKVPNWIYPLGAVASLMIGALVWWGMGSVDAPDSTGKLALRDRTHDVDSARAASNSNTTGAPVVAGGSAGAGGTNATGVAVNTTGDDKVKLLERSFTPDTGALSDAESQARNLIARSDESPANIFLNDPAQ